VLAIHRGRGADQSIEAVTHNAGQCGEALGERTWSGKVGEAIHAHISAVDAASRSSTGSRETVRAAVAEHRNQCTGARVGPVVERLGEAGSADRGTRRMCSPICGRGTSMDMVARSRWSRSRYAQNSSLSRRRSTLAEA